MQMFARPLPGLKDAALLLGVIVGTITCLSLGATFFVPIVVALLLALLLNLPLRQMQSLGSPSWLAALILVTALGLVLALLLALVAEPLQTFASDYRTILSELRIKLFSLQHSLSEAAAVGSAISEVSEGVSQALEDPAVQEVVVRDSSFLVQAASSVAEYATTFVATMTICGFILTVRRPFLTFATMPFAAPARKLRAARIWREVERFISYFFLVTTAINATLGVTVGAALYALDVPNAVFWGVLVGLLNYMPFIGPTIGAVALLAFCVLEYNTFWQMLLPALVYLAINFIEANFVTPSLVGRKMEIPTLAVILSLFFWSWLWGIVGLLVAMPVLVVLKALSLHIEPLSGLRRVLTPRA